MVASTLFRFIFQPIEKFCNVCVGLWICRLYHLVLTKPVLPKWKSGLKRFRQINHSLNEDTMKNTSTSGQQENGRTDSSPIPSISFPSVHSKIKTMNKLVLIRNQQKKKKKERKRKHQESYLGNSLTVQWLGLGAFTAGARFNPWSGNWDPASCVAQPKKKEKEKERKEERKKGEKKNYFAKEKSRQNGKVSEGWNLLFFKICIEI